MILITGLCILLGYVKNTLRVYQRQSDAIARLETHNAIFEIVDPWADRKLLKGRFLRATDVFLQSKADLDLIADLPFLTSLNLPGNTNDSDIRLISRFGNMRNVKELDLYVADVTDVSVKDLARFSSLEELDVWDAPLSTSAVLELSRLPRMKKMRFRHELGAKELAAFVEDGRLESNELSLNAIEAEDLGRLADAFISTPQYDRMHLSISDSKVDRAWCEPLKRVRVSTLKFRACDIATELFSDYELACDELSVSWRSAPHLVNGVRKAETMELRPRKGRTLEIQMKSPNGCAVEFSAFGDADQLLDAIHPNMQVSGALKATTSEYFEKLPTSLIRSAERIELDDSDDDTHEKSRYGKILRRIAAVAPMTRIRELSIADDSFDDDAFSSISKMPNLEHLRIATPAVSGAGFSHLSDLRHLSSLAIEPESILLYSLSETEFCELVKPLKQLRRIELSGRVHPIVKDPLFRAIEKDFPWIEVKSF